MKTTKKRGLIALVISGLLAAGTIFGGAPALAGEGDTPTVEIAPAPEEITPAPAEEITPEPAPEPVAAAPQPEPAPEPAPAPAPAPEPAPIIEEAPAAPTPDAPSGPTDGPQAAASVESTDAGISVNPPLKPLVELLVEEEIPPANLLGSAGGTCPPVPPGQIRDDFVIRITLTNGTTETVPVVQTGTITATVLAFDDGPVLPDGVFTVTLASGEQAFITYPHPLAPRLPEYGYKVVYTNADTGAIIGHSFAADFEGVCATHETPGLVPPNPEASIEATDTPDQALVKYTVPLPTGAGEYTTDAPLIVRVDGLTVATPTAQPGVPGSTTIGEVCGPDGPKRVEVVYDGNVIADSLGLDFGCVTDPVVVPASPTVTITAGPNQGQVTVASSNPLPGGENTTTTEVTLGVEVGGTPLAPIVLAPGGSDSLVLDVCSPDGAQLVVVSYNGNPLATSEGVAVSCAPDGPSTVPATPFAYLYLFEGDLYAWLDNPETHDPEHFVPEDILYEFELNDKPYEGGDPITVEGGSTVQDYLVYDNVCDLTGSTEFSILATKYNYVVESGNLFDPENDLYIDCDEPGNGGGNGGGNGNSELCKETGAGWQPKVDVNGDPAPVTAIAPDGFLIDKYCVKAGTTTHIIPVDPASGTVVIDHPIKDSVSHYQVHLIPVDDGGENPGGGNPGGETPGTNPDNGGSNPGGEHKPDKGPKVKSATSAASSGGTLAFTGTPADQLAAQQAVGTTTIVMMALVIAAFLIGAAIRRKRAEQA